VNSNTSRKPLESVFGSFGIAGFRAGKGKERMYKNS